MGQLYLSIKLTIYNDKFLFTLKVLGDNVSLSLSLIYEFINTVLDNFNNSIDIDTKSFNLVCLHVPIKMFCLTHF